MWDEFIKMHCTTKSLTITIYIIVRRRGPGKQEDANYLSPRSSRATHRAKGSSKNRELAENYRGVFSLK
jgi:hypothetical protein